VFTDIEVRSKNFRAKLNSQISAHQIGDSCLYIKPSADAHNHPSSPSQPSVRAITTIHPRHHNHPSAPSQPSIRAITTIHPRHHNHPSPPSQPSIPAITTIHPHHHNHISLPHLVSRSIIPKLVLPSRSLMA
jgi:hypothetical protein